MTTDTIQKKLVRWFKALDSKLPPVFLVGGAVRDLLLKRHANDLDLACRNAADVAGRLAGRHAAALVRFEKKPGEACYRVVDRQHPENFIDLLELYDSDILRDLNRRDFTINAMAMPIRAGGRLGGLVDPHNGRSDLNGRIVRVVRPQAFSDDPLRVLRAWRFAAELGCRIDDTTRTHMASHAHQLGSVAVERIVYELFRILVTDDAVKWVREMAGLAVLDVLFPEKGGRNGSDCHQKSWCDALAVLEGVETALRSAHTRYKRAAGQVLDYLRKDNRLPLLKLAALLHAIAWTDRGDAGPVADGIGRRLKLSNRDRDYLTGLLAALDDVFIIAAGDSGRSVRVRFFRSSPNAGMGALVLGDGVLGADIDMIPAELDRRAGSQRLSQTIVDYYTRIRAKLAEKDLIGGTDLISSGILPGPSLGKILREVRRAQDEGTVASREDALRLALKISGRES